MVIKFYVQNQQQKKKIQIIIDLEKYLIQNEKINPKKKQMITKDHPLHVI